MLIHQRSRKFSYRPIRKETVRVEWDIIYVVVNICMDTSVKAEEKVTVTFNFPVEEFSHLQGLLKIGILKNQLYTIVVPYPNPKPAKQLFL